MAKVVIHRDGIQEIFQTEKIIQAIQQVIDPLKLSDPFIPMFKIIKNFELKLPDQVTTGEIDRLLLKAIEGLISEDTIYDAIATAQLVKIINETVNMHFKSFREYIEFGVQEKLLSADLLWFDIDTLELSINYDFDKEFNYFGLDTLQDRYLVKNRQKATIEKPQWMRMRVAMGLALLEKDRETYTLKLYRKFAQLKYIHSTPTLYNAGTPHSQLSSCYINVLEDSMESIMEKATETAQFAKFAGGVGTSITKLRASGSHIKSLNAKSSGPIPFIKIFDTVVNSIMQGGRRRSSQVIYMEPRHYNFEEFLDLKETNGNDYVRTRSLNTACWIPDEFMKRVIHDEDRYMLDPAECPELTTTRGKAFSDAYQNICERAEAGDIKLFKKVKAQDLYREILMRAAKTGNYWLNFKDRHNEKNQAPAYSMIHSSNLCTEISIPNSEESTAVCTLASVNLARVVDHKSLNQADLVHMSVEQKANLINWDELKDTIHTAIRALDNVLDINYYPSAASKKNSLDLRPLGLGVMGLGELLIQLHIPYEHKDALTLSDQLGAFMYAESLAASTALAEERGTFADWSADRYSYGPRRNALLLAIAPTASISNIAGTSSGIETFFANVYSRETISGKYTIIVKQLVDQLKEAGVRNEDIKNKVIEKWGSVQHITELEGHLDKQIFKTVYETTPFSQVDIAAVRQKYVDQSISRNMYVKEELRDNLFDIYVYARQQGLKSTYYCFIEKTIQGEKYTQKINKRGERLGFGKAPETTTQTTIRTPHTESQPVTPLDPKNLSEQQKNELEQQLRATKGDSYVDQLKAWTLYNGACPIDPFEKVMCTSCQ